MITDNVDNNNELDPEEKALFDELWEVEEANRKAFKEALERFKTDGVYVGDFGLVEEFFDDNSSNQHIGYVNIVHCPEIKPGFGRSSSNDKFYRIVADANSEQLSDTLKQLVFQCNYEEGDEGNRLEYLAYQQEDYEDCYSGFLLLPMNNGMYWLTVFEM